MREISEEAHVSERTAYLAYPSKLGLRLEVIGVATTGGDDPTPLAERPEFRDALSEWTILGTLPADASQGAGGRASK